MSERGLRECADALRAIGLDDVSRETLERLVSLVALLRDWNQTQNLVARSAHHEIWTRHVADSAQLRMIAPDVMRWLDLGSGAGFPGLVLAALLPEGGTVHLVESNARKCAFLQEAIRVTGVAATVHRRRIEEALPNWQAPVDGISARAVAPLNTLIAWIDPLLTRRVPAYLHKGLDFSNELAATPDRAGIDLIQHRSRIGPGFIVELRRTQNAS